MFQLIPKLRFQLASTFLNIFGIQKKETVTFYFKLSVSKHFSGLGRWLHLDPQHPPNQIAGADWPAVEPIGELCVQRRDLVSKNKVEKQ